MKNKLHENELFTQNNFEFYLNLLNTTQKVDPKKIKSVTKKLKEGRYLTKVVAYKAAQKMLTQLYHH